MENQQNQNQGVLVNVKRVRRDKLTGRGKNQDKDYEQVVLTFGLDKEGNNSADALIEALQAYKGKQINFDIRLEKKQTQSGTTFDAAFVLVKEMIPRGADSGATYTPKVDKSKQATLASADRIRKQFGK